MLTANGPRTDVSDVTTYTYYRCTTGYQCGQVYTVTNAAGHVTTYNTYNAHGRPLTITDPNGLVTTLTYDARQRLTSRSLGSELTTFTYWPTGLLKKATLPDGSFLGVTVTEQTDCSPPAQGTVSILKKGDHLFEIKLTGVFDCSARIQPYLTEPVDNKATLVLTLGDSEKVGFSSSCECGRKIGLTMQIGSSQETFRTS